MQALSLLRIQAHANRMANLRLRGVLGALSDAEFQAPRTGFFPSLQATLDHIVAVDAYYVGVLHGDAGLAEAWQTRVPKRTLADWHSAQQAVDQRLIAWLLAADDAALDAPVHMPRGRGRVQIDAAAHMLQHLFSHQTHHRGQVHAMLSSTGVAPPQLDEFLMPSEPHLRRAEMAALGWDEAAVYGHQNVARQSVR